MDTGIRRAAVIGGVVGLVCIVAVISAVVLGQASSGARDDAVDGPVIVALVLPDEDGVLTVRVLERLAKSGTRIRMTAVDPLTSATVPGTSAKTLAEAYSFGGGDGLVAAIASNTSDARPAWILVKPDGWAALAGATPVRISLAADIEVFDGTRLYSYRAGETSVTPDEIAQLMNGAAYLSPPERASVREAIGATVTSLLARGYSSTGGLFESSLTAEQVRSLFGDVKSEPVRADTTQ